MFIYRASQNDKLLFLFSSHLTDCSLSLLIKKNDFDVSNREIIGLLKNMGPSNQIVRRVCPCQDSCRRKQKIQVHFYFYIILDGWLNADDIGCFKFLETGIGLTWVEGQQKCEDIGGYLAEPHTHRYSFLYCIKSPHCSYSSLCDGGKVSQIWYLSAR
jgi:hypothetical protein